MIVEISVPFFDEGELNTRLSCEKTLARIERWPSHGKRNVFKP